MDVSLKSNKNLNFGELYIKKGFIKNKTYRYNDGIFELARKQIEELAKNVDIFIKYKNLKTKGFDIKIYDKIESPIKRYLNYLFSCSVLKEKIRPEDLFLSKENPTDLLIEKVKTVKENFKKFHDYITKS